MAFCMNCGHEVPDDKKFCPECGASMEGAKDGVGGGRVQSALHIALPIIDRFGRVYGIVLLFLSLLVAVSEPPIRTIFGAVLLIAAGVFCFYRRYRWKGFTIAAMVITVIGLIAAMNQAKETGLFRSQKQVEEEQQAEAEREAEAAYAELMKEYPETGDTEETLPYEKADQSSRAAGQSEDDALTPSEDAAEQDALTEDETVAADALSEDETAAADAADGEETEEADTVSEDAAESKADADGVSPDLKAFLDSYEEFMDEYCAFMKKYNSDPGNAISMTADYMKMLAKAEEFSAKAEKYDSEEMSKADAKYYVETMARIEAKMIDCY